MTNSSKGSCATITPPDRPDRQLERLESGAKEKFRSLTAGIGGFKNGGVLWSSGPAMKLTSFSRIWVIALCGLGMAASGALRPEGDKIEFSPLQEELKVPPLRGSDPERPEFNFKRRDSGASVTDVPAATLALPSPDQVNRLKALQEMIDQRGAWANPNEDDDDLDGSLSLRPKAADSEITIDDLFDRRSRLKGGVNRFEDREKMTLDRDRDADRDRMGRDRRGRDDRDSLDRDRRFDNRLSTELENDPSELNRQTSENDLNGSKRDRQDGTSGRVDPISGERRSGGDNFLGINSMIPGSVNSLKDGIREAPTREDRLESLRRVLGSSATTILGPAGTSRSSARDSITGQGLLGTAGSVPGANRSLSETMDSRFGATVPGTSLDDRPGVQRVTLPTSRSFDLDAGPARSGFGSKNDRLQGTPPPTPMDLFRKKHDSRIPTRDF